MSIPSGNPMVCQIPGFVSRHGVLQLRRVGNVRRIYEDRKKTGIRDFAPRYTAMRKRAAIVDGRMRNESEAGFGKRPARMRVGRGNSLRTMAA
jgi:hypothetical protein